MGKGIGERREGVLTFCAKKFADIKKKQYLCTVKYAYTKI